VHTQTIRANKQILQSYQIQSQHNKNQLPFHTLTMNNLKRKLRKQLHLHASKRIKNSRINQEDQAYILKTTKHY
jgi:hypothetical protein